jgi:exodeoxyribonuclease V alpha subunit
MKPSGPRPAAFSPADRALGRLLQQVLPVPASEPRRTLMVWLAEMASAQFGRGHACLDLSQPSDWPLPGPEANPDEFPNGYPDDHPNAPEIVSPVDPPVDLPVDPVALADAASRLPWAEPGGPLVLTGHSRPERLYLRRAWQAEQTIRQAMQARLHPAHQPVHQPAHQPVHPSAHHPPEAGPAVHSGMRSGTRSVADGAASLAAPLAQLFPGGGVDWQKTACALAARAPLLLLTGGPGTGKTTTVGRMLALLQSRALTAGRPLRIHLAAPTGKAAARMNESLAAALASLPEPFREQLHKYPPAPAQTLHRLLRLRPDGMQRAPELLDTDLLVVDEASMIDLETLARLFQSVPTTATLVLLGDRDQLASVEAGSAWAQLCEGAEQGAYSTAARQWLASAGVELPPAPPEEGASATAPSPWADATVMLRLSRRFGADSAIGQWATAINSAHTAAHTATPTTALMPLLRTVPSATAVWQGLFPGRAWAEFRELLATPDTPDTPDTSAPPSTPDHLAQALLVALGRFQVLCAVRDGPWGVHHMNRRIARALGLPADGWYAGRAVMVTRNDPALQLMNGDVGLCLWRDGAWRVAFPRAVVQSGTASHAGAGIHWVAASRLSEVETAFAMTIHKSQGSEFDEVLLVLPEEAGAILTRELLYTGLTRARQQLHWLLPKPSVLLEGVQRRVRRQGGLAGPEQPVWLPVSLPVSGAVSGADSSTTQQAK